MTTLASDQEARGISMEQTKTDTQSFIIKIWLEETAAENRRTIWRGHITHVPSGERRYIKSLGEIIDFIFLYLEAMHAKIEIYWCIRRMARQWIHDMNHRRSTWERRK